jgi:predicted tellurium resistance membrane protein TerC
MLDALLRPESLASFLTLSAMEIVLGIDNVVFLSILASRLPAERQAGARRTGLVLALGIRIGLLFAIAWVIGLTKPLFTLPLVARSVSGRDLILLGGGLFLIWKSTQEIYEKLEGDPHAKGGGGKAATMTAVIFQILVMDAIFSLDSVITAVGMVSTKADVPGAREAGLAIMICAMVVAMLFMLLFAAWISAFVSRHPSMKILALSFLLLIGVMLVAEGWGAHVSKGYIYSAMAFSLFVELLNMRFRKKRAPVELHTGYRAF